MQQNLTEKIIVKLGAPPMDAATARIRDISKTLLAIMLVCCAMPFLTMGYGDLSETLSLWQIATRLWRLDMVKALPDTMRNMVLLARMMAWTIMGILAFSWVVMVTRYRGNHFLAVMISSFIGLGFCIGIYFYLQYLFLAGLEQDFVLIYGNGAIVLIAGFLLCGLILLTTKMKKRTMMATVLILLVIPATIAFGILFLGDRKYYVISLLIVFETMLPFFMVFESRKPEAREMILIAVMSAIAAVGRAAFAGLPFFKPLVAIVIITGVSLGPEAGFLVGALSGFVSNFLFGQGPWTPWQMFSYGICGYIAGILFRKKLLTKKRIPLCIFGAAVALLVCGPLLDLCAFFTMAMEQTPKMFFAVFVSGFPVNLVHATATATFLALLAKPMNEKLDRIKKKYGLMEP